MRTPAPSGSRKSALGPRAGPRRLACSRRNPRNRTDSSWSDRSPDWSICPSLAAAVGEQGYALAPAGWNPELIPFRDGPQDSQHAIVPEPRRSSRALAEIEPHIRRPDRWIRGNEARLRKQARSNLELLDGVQPATRPRLGNLRGRASGSLGALQASQERIRALVFCKPVCNVGQDLKIVSPIQRRGNRCPHCVSEALADQKSESFSGCFQRLLQRLPAPFPVSFPVPFLVPLLIACSNHCSVHVRCLFGIVFVSRKLFSPAPSLLGRPPLCDRSVLTRVFPCRMTSLDVASALSASSASWLCSQRNSSSPRIRIRSGWATPWQPRPDGTTQASLGRPQNVRRTALAGLWACEESKTSR